jgi:hypothetical protein
MFAERLRALGAPTQDAGETREDALQAASPRPEGEGTAPKPASNDGIVLSPITAMMIAAGVGVAAGVINPLLIAQLENPLWLGAFLLWALPPIFGFWLGRNVGSQMAAMAEKQERRERDRRDRRGAREVEPKGYGEESRDVGEIRWAEQGNLESWRGDPDSAEPQKRYLRSRLPIYAMIIGTGALLSNLAAFWFGISLVQTTIPLRTVLGVAIAQGIVAVMFVLFAGLVGAGSVRQRQEADRPKAGGSNFAKSLAANRQALIGLVGTIITAILAFGGVVVQVFVSGGNGG